MKFIDDPLNGSENLVGHVNQMDELISLAMDDEKYATVVKAAKETKFNVEAHQIEKNEMDHNTIDILNNFMSVSKCVGSEINNQPTIAEEDKYELENEEHHVEVSRLYTINIDSKQIYRKNKD